MDPKPFFIITSLRYFLTSLITYCAELCQDPGWLPGNARFKTGLCHDDTRMMPGNSGIMLGNAGMIDVRIMPGNAGIWCQEMLGLIGLCWDGVGKCRETYAGKLQQGNARIMQGNARIKPGNARMMPGKTRITKCQDYVGKCQDAAGKC